MKGGTQPNKPLKLKMIIFNIEPYGVNRSFLCREIRVVQVSKVIARSCGPHHGYRTPDVVLD